MEVKMSNITVEAIIDQALKRPEKERALIAERLISSLDSTNDKDVELAWQDEIEKRLKEIDPGIVQCITWEDVREQLYKNAHAGN
jgi:putative addiction module component (TIGR02574 family)